MSRRACTESSRLREHRSRPTWPRCRSSTEPQTTQQVKPSTKKFLDGLLAHPGILISQAVPHPIADLLKEFASSKKLIPRGHLPGSQHPISVNAVQEFLSGFHGDELGASQRKLSTSSPSCCWVERGFVNVPDEGRSAASTVH